MLRRAAPALVLIAVALAGILGLASRPDATTPTQHADYVVVAGAAGLRWDDVNPTDTPTLWKLAQEGSVGALSVRSATSPTCPSDGWLTLGAGNFAERGQLPVAGQCPAMQVPLTHPDNIGASLSDQAKIVQLNKELPYGAQPGALSEAVRCTAAVGVGAAVAAARPYGRVDKYSDDLPTDFRSYLASCVLSMVDLGTLDAADPVARQAQARQVDARLATVLANRPDRSLVLVAGLADTQAGTRLHVAIADGPGYHGGWLTSSSTARSGYVQLADLAPTVLTALDKPLPTGLFAGAAATSTGGRPDSLRAAVRELADADRQASAQHRVAGGFFGALAGVELVLFAAVVPLLRRARRHAGQHGLRPAPPWLTRPVELALVAAALAIPAALVADAVPWWRTSSSGLLFAGVTVALAVALTAAVAAGPWWRGALGPAGAVGGISAVIIGLDVLTGARLQLNGVAGYSALEGGRYAGLGTVGLGLFTAGVLLFTGALVQRAGRRWRPVAVAAIGAVAIVVVGSPYLGADAGGAVALTAGVCLAAAICTGGWLTFARLAWATLAGIAVTAGFALLDLRRPEADRGRLAQLLSTAGGGDSLPAGQRPAAPNVFGFSADPLTLVAFGALLLAAIGMLAPWGGLKRVFGLYPSVRAALVGITVAALIGGLVDGVGFTVAGAAAATAVPVAALAALRVLDHADDRTVAVAALASVPLDWPLPAAPSRPGDRGTAAAGTPEVAGGAADTEPDDHRDTDLPEPDAPGILAPDPAPSHDETPEPAPTAPTAKRAPRAQAKAPGKSSGKSSGKSLAKAPAKADAVGRPAPPVATATVPESAPDGPARREVGSGG